MEVRVTVLALEKSRAAWRLPGIEDGGPGKDRDSDLALYRPVVKVITRDKLGSRRRTCV